MTIVASDVAGKDFAQLLKRAAEGEEIVITEGGAPIAKLVPVEEPAQAQRFPMSPDELDEWRKGNRLGPDLTIEQLIREGRRS